MSAEVKIVVAVCLNRAGGPELVEITTEDLFDLASAKCKSLKERIAFYLIDSVEVKQEV